MKITITPGCVIFVQSFKRTYSYFFTCGKHFPFSNTCFFLIRTALDHKAQDAVLESLSLFDLFFPLFSEKCPDC